MANVELKQPMVQEIAGCVDGAQAVVVVDYRGLNVAQDTELRKQMRDAGITYKVYKNTLMKRAFEGTDFAQLDPVLEGPSAIAVSKDDATAPARLIAKFAKQAEALEFKAGVVEGGFYDAEGMAVIATIPTREELLGRLFGSMQSPIASFARVINQIAENGGAQVEEAAADEAPAEAESNLASSSEEEAKPEVVEEPTAVEAESESPESADA
ncbi:MAG: 50S ribosomal protein L10 [Clostridiales bacterium]|nr:50S ribosomal protein L10 [Clostridiales bacterium]